MEYHLYNTETGEFFPNLTAGEISAKIGVDSYHCASYASRPGLYDKVWHIINAETIQAPGFNKAMLPVPIALYAEMIAKFKAEYREAVANAFRAAVIGTHGYTELYLLDESGNVSEVFTSYKEAGNFLNLKEATVKTRVFRLSLFPDNPKFFNLCKSSDYEQVKKRYY